MSESIGAKRSGSFQVLTIEGAESQVEVACRPASCSGSIVTIPTAVAVLSRVDTHYASQAGYKASRKVTSVSTITIFHSWHVLRKTSEGLAVARSDGIF